MTKTTLKNILRNTFLAAGLAGGVAASSGCLPLIAIAEVDNAMAQHRIANALENQNRQNSNSAAEPEDYFFALNRWEDNGDGCVSLDELRGRGKTNFRTNEPLSFCLYGNRETGDIQFVLKDISGRMLAKTNEYVKRGSCPIRWYMGELSEGEYTAEWSRNGSLIGSTTVRLKAN